jgi:hypothetical protein
MNTNNLLEKFISFILLLSLPKNPSIFSGNFAHTEPGDGGPPPANPIPEGNA